MPRIAGVRLARGAPEAVDHADVVLSVNSSRAAVAAAEACADALASVEVYADLNTAAPATKVAVADALRESGALFADVALLGPVPARGIGTAALASGPGAEAFARRFLPLGMPVDVVGTEPGIAAQRKLLRSVFMKGLAASIGESLAGAEAAGHQEWLRAEIGSMLASADAALVDRFVDGSRRHAGRRVDEMNAACEVLRELGVSPHIAAAAAARLAELAEPV